MCLAIAWNASAGLPTRSVRYLYRSAVWFPVRISNFLVACGLSVYDHSVVDIAWF